MAQVVVKLGLEGATLVERDQCLRLAIVSVEEHPPAESYRSASSQADGGHIGLGAYTKMHKVKVKPARRACNSPVPPPDSVQPRLG